MKKLYKMERFFLSVTGVVSGYFIFGILFSVENLFVHQEYYTVFAPCVIDISEGINFKLSDFKALFHVCFDGGAYRPRFYSWFFWMIDIKFRTVLFNLVPFHPTISLTWIFTFTLFPFYFFKLMRNLNCDTNVSLVSTFLLLCSQGVLSSFAMYFHSAKPMTLVFLVINLYMASVMHNNFLNKKNINRMFYIKWFAVLLISLFWDELFYVFFLITPWIFRKSIFSKKIIAPYIIINLALFFLFIVINFVVAPYMAKMLYSSDFNFLFQVSDQVSFSNLSFEAIKHNAMSLIDSHMNFTKPIPGFSWSYKGGFYLVVFIFVVLITVLKRNQLNPHIFSVTISFLIFLGFQQLLLLGRYGSLMHGSFYWGSPFSILFSIWMGLLLSSLNFRFKYLSYCIVAILCLASYRHTVTAVQGHMEDSYCKDNISELRLLELEQSQEITKYPYHLIYDIWKNKDNPGEVKKLLKGKPCNSLWLFYEIKIYQSWKKKHLENG